MADDQSTDKRGEDKDAAPFSHEQALKLREHWYDGGRLSDWQIGALLDMACGDRCIPSATPSSDKRDELPGMLEVAKGVAEQRWPHTMDAAAWAREFMERNTGSIVGTAGCDEGLMLSWFANAIMAGYDTAQARAAQSASTAHANRWQAGLRFGFPEFCSHWEGAPNGTGVGWYHQLTVDQHFATAEEAMDAAIATTMPPRYVKSGGPNG